MVRGQLMKLRRQQIACRAEASEQRITNVGRCGLARDSTCYLQVLLPQLLRNRLGGSAIVCVRLFDRRYELIRDTLERRRHDDPSRVSRIGGKQFCDVDDRGSVRERGASELVHDGG